MLKPISQPRLERAFHSFEALGIDGLTDEPRLRDTAKKIFPASLEGKTLIDVGAWDGWYSFEAERRGAKQVTACDWFCWSGPGWGTRDTFDFVRLETGSQVNALECDIPALNPVQHGTFDIVLLMGVLYHVTDMRETLGRVASICRERLVVETETIPSAEPVARYWRGDSLNGDGSNFWSPSVSCVTAMLQELGFSTFEVMPTPHFPQTETRTRHIIHALR